MSRVGDRWPSTLAALGYTEPTRVGVGVEGTVYRIGGGKVAKVWAKRSVGDIERLAAFYVDVAAADPLIATPLIESATVVDGHAVSIERELPGTALQHLLDDAADGLPAAATDAIIQCLRVLRIIPGSPAMRDLAVVGEKTPFRAPGDTFSRALVALLDRRVTASAKVLNRALPDFADRYKSLQSQLSRLDEVPDTAVHGDLLGTNIHVDGDARPVAMLDFGFMTTAGDPRFDAAVTAAIVNMYGPHARRITDSLTAEIAQRLGYDRTVLDLYRSAYAVATATQFGNDVDEGHFRWCIDQLRR